MGWQCSLKCVLGTCKVLGLIFITKNKEANKTLQQLKTIEQIYKNQKYYFEKHHVKWNGPNTKGLIL